VSRRNNRSDYSVNPNFFSNELLSVGKISRFISYTTGYSEEESYLKLTMPRVGKKSKFISRDFDFVSLVGMNKATGEPTVERVADFVSCNTGKSLEQSYNELIMPKVNFHASRDIMLGKTIDMDIFF
jgi:hypothetical protein